MFDKLLEQFVVLVAAQIVKMLGPDAIAKNIAQHLNKNHLAEVVCDTLDLSEIEQEIAKKVHVDADTIAGEIDLSELAAQIDKGALADCVTLDYAKILDKVEIDYSSLAQEISASDIAYEISTSDVAEHISASDIASEIDMSSLADEIDVSDIASSLDYESLAKALLAQFAKKVEVRPANT